MPNNLNYDLVRSHVARAFEDTIVPRRKSRWNDDLVPSASGRNGFRATRETWESDYSSIIAKIKARDQRFKKFPSNGSERNGSRNRPLYDSINRMASRLWRHLKSI